MTVAVIELDLVPVIGFGQPHPPDPDSDTNPWRPRHAAPGRRSLNLWRALRTSPGAHRALEVVGQHRLTSPRTADRGPVPRTAPARTIRSHRARP